MMKPIFVSTVFKSGTKLLEHLLSRLTGLDVLTPPMSISPNYESAKIISFEPGKFFVWHNNLNRDVIARIIQEGAKPIFLVRNIYDLAVSQYFHFALDVDDEIGHSTKTIQYFARMSLDQGISVVLCGVTSEEFHWQGFGVHLSQIQEMLRFSLKYPCHVVIYDRLVLDKAGEIERLAKFLGINITPELLNDLIASSSLGAMRAARASKAGIGRHFRKGVPGSHVEVLGLNHYDMINWLKLNHAPELDALCMTLGYGDVVAGLSPETRAAKKVEMNEQRVR